MKFAPIPPDEENRLFDLKRYFILDTPSEVAFDEITRLAAMVCDVNISLVSIVDKDRQWFKSRFGLEASETPRDISFCGHTIMEDDIFIVEDAEADHRFFDNPLVLNAPHMKFYAGVPLITPSANRIGTLCVIGNEKKTLTHIQKETLKSLAKHVIHLLEIKLKNLELQAQNSRYSVLFNQPIDAVMTLAPPHWHFTSANAATLKLFGANSLQQFCLLSPGNVSPEFQPDGTRSSDKAKEMIRIALEKGSHFFEWTHLKLTGEPMECKVLLSKITEGETSYLHASVRNVSNEKKLQTQLIEAQAISKVGSWSLNLETNEQIWSLEHYKIFEMDSPQPQDKLYELYRSRIHPEDLTVLDQFMDQALSLGKGFIFDHRVIFDGGKRVKYVQGIGKVSRNALGKVNFLAGTCRDMTNDIEKEIRKKKILESMEEGLVIHDQNGKITQFNTAALKILEMSQDQILGKTSDDSAWKAIKENGEPFPGIEHPAMVALTTGQIVQHVIMGLRFDKMRVKWIRLNATPFQEFEQKNVLVTFSDITDLVESKEENRFALETVGVGIWKYNPISQELFWDNSMYALYEISPGEFSGHFDAWSSSLSEQSKVEALDSMEKALKGEKEFNLDFEIYTKSRRRIIGAKGKVLRNSEGQATMMYGTNWDRTKEVELEKSLDAEKAKSIQNARLALIGELAAGVGHEINNPLAIISGHIQITNNILSSPEPALSAALDRLKKMDSAVGRIASIVKSLRTFARSDDVQITFFDPYVLCSETIEMLKELYLQEEILLTFSGDHRISYIEGVRGKIQQVLVNLISNGKDASLGKKNRKVEVSISYDVEEIKIFITDNGSGISNELKEKIFAPFFTTKDVNKGTGMGLSLTKNIVHEHNGKLDFVTKMDEGTTFILILPITWKEKNVTPLAAKTITTSKYEIIDCNVLIVDDEEDLLEIFKFIVSKFCSNVVTARGAREGYNLLTQGRIDIVMSDIKMPEIDGFGFLRMIKENKAISPPKFVFITGGVQMSPVELKIVEESTDGLITKPFVEAEVYQKIKSISP